MRLKFKGKRAIVLGGSSALGVSLSQQLIKTGIRPLLTVRGEKQKAFVHSLISSHDNSCDIQLLDITEKSHCTSFLEKSPKTFDYWVDLIHSDIEALIGAIPNNTLLNYMNQELAHHALLTKIAARHLLKNRWGRIVYVSSAAARLINPGQGFYAAGKRAMEALYQSIGIELGGKGITSVILRPGYIDGGRGKRYLEKNPELIKKRIPIKRALNVNEVTESILYLLSDSALGINATTLTMDGGISATK